MSDIRNRFCNYYLLIIEKFFKNYLRFYENLLQIITITYIRNSELTLKSIFTETDIPIAFIILILIIDNILYLFLAIYLDQVIPGQYGSKQNFCFCLTKNFWFPDENKQNIRKALEKNENIEEVSDELKKKAVINIEKISKKFGKNIAVNEISMTIYESEITALLGHNGAGKSTLINMLIGCLTPTSGTAYIYGRDISDPLDMYELRSMFGICFQENILFDELN